MNCTRCRHQGRRTYIKGLDTRGRKWCADCDEAAAYGGWCLAQLGARERLAFDIFGLTDAERRAGRVRPGTEHREWPEATP